MIMDPPHKSSTDEVLPQQYGNGLITSIISGTSSVAQEIGKMRSGSVEAGRAAPVLVLGLGNVLLGDDGVGPTLVEELARRYSYAGGLVEFLDGGTQGLALLGRLSDRAALVVLDAVAAGRPPGSVSVLEGQEVLRFATSRSTTAPEGNAGELLATAAFLGELPEQCYIVGVEPKSVKTGLGLSRDVHRSLQTALEKAQDVLDMLLAELTEPAHA
jgi:hydrogenase maturation protease